MGTWGIHPYENDTALDWGSDTSGDPDAIEDALGAVLQVQPNDYLEIELGIIGVAACQGMYDDLHPRSGLIARLLKRPAPAPLPADPQLVAKAIACLDRVILPSSELNDLWAESHDYQPWLQSIADLRNKLAQLPG